MVSPNQLTFLRVLLLPLLVIFFIVEFPYHHLWAAAVFMIAACTDWLDGYLARTYGKTSRFGAFLDPVADKLLVITACILVVMFYHNGWVAVPVMMMIGREIAVSALREWMACLGKQVAMTVRRVAQVKTALQLIALSILLLGATPSSLMYHLGITALYAAMALTLYSMCVYLKNVKSDLTMAS